MESTISAKCAWLLVESRSGLIGNGFIVIDCRNYWILFLEDKINVVLGISKMVYNILMGTIQAKKIKNQLKNEINANIVLISSIHKKIQNFISLCNIFEEEEQVEKIQTEIIGDYKILCSSNTKIKDAYKFLPQDDTEFVSLYQNYSNKLFSLTKHYKNFLNELLIGSRTLAIVDNTSAKGFALYIYDLQTAKTSFHNSDMFEGEGCAIALPNSQLLICCRGWGKDKNVVGCIFDIKSKTEKRICIDFKYLYSGGIYYKNRVYLFWGFIHNNPENKAGIFDLEKNVWYNATPFPTPTHQCSCTVFNDSILIFGSHHKKLYKYDINTDSYSKICTVKGGWGQVKILFTASSRVYFLINERIFESELENEYVYTRISNKGISLDLVSQVKYYNNCVWFMGAWRGDLQAFKFQLNTKELESFNLTLP